VKPRVFSGTDKQEITAIEQNNLVILFIPFTTSNGYMKVKGILRNEKKLEGVRRAEQASHDTVN